MSATYRFTRNVSAYSSTMTAVELAFVNQSESAINSIKLTSKKLTGKHLFQFQAASNNDAHRLYYTPIFLLYK